MSLIGVVSRDQQLKTTASRELSARAQRLIPGGVNSPVRAFRAVGGDPLWIARGQGSRVWDVDGNSFIDFLGSWGPLILGHAHPAVVDAIQNAAKLGTSYGAPNPAELELAELITGAMPSIEMVRFVSSGTEATMSAIRLARAFTGRDLIVKFDGGYHGHADVLLARAGSGIATHSLPDSAGVPAETVRHTLVAPFNDASAVEELFRANSDRIAAVIVEPVAGNMGVVPPASGFLENLRDVTERNGALLILDEVMTGFRVAWGGAGQVYGIRADLTCLGKIVGGGMPVGAFGGRRDIMSMVAPSGPVYQAGTLSGNPLAMAAGIATLRVVRELQPYAELERRTAVLCAGLEEGARESGTPVTIQRVGSMFTAFFAASPIRNYAEARTADVSRYARFFQAMLAGGVYLAPSQFEAAFVSASHSDDDIERTINVAREALRR